MKKINLRSFKAKVRYNKKNFKKYLQKLHVAKPPSLPQVISKIEKQIWKEIDCLGCANCCKSMTPTYTFSDIKRIAAHFNLRPVDFKNKWLVQEKSGTKDWMK